MTEPAPTDDPYRQPDRFSKIEQELEAMAKTIGRLDSAFTRKRVGRGTITALCVALPCVLLGVLFFLPGAWWSFARGMGCAILAGLTVFVYIFRFEMRDG